MAEQYQTEKHRLKVVMVEKSITIRWLVGHLRKNNAVFSWCLNKNKSLIPQLQVIVKIIDIRLLLTQT